MEFSSETTLDSEDEVCGAWAAVAAVIAAATVAGALAGLAVVMRRLR